jgi:hypothetical protein
VFPAEFKASLLFQPDTSCHAPLLFEEDVERIFMEKFSGIAGLQQRLAPGDNPVTVDANELWLVMEGSAVAACGGSSIVAEVGHVVNEMHFLLPPSSSANASPATVISPGPRGCCLCSITRHKLAHADLAESTGFSWYKPDPPSSSHESPVCSTVCDVCRAIFTLLRQALSLLVLVSRQPTPSCLAASGIIARHSTARRHRETL